MLGTHKRTLTSAPNWNSVRRTRQVRTVVVCLPPDTDPRRLPELAATRLRLHSLTANGTVQHFVARTRRTSKLIDCWQGVTSGGPIRLLDLAAMRHQAAAAASARWQLWQHVTAGTRPAQPFWQFLDRHRADPDRYPLERAQSEYISQPRVLAMKVHNAMPNRICELPTGSLEIFQAGPGTYVSVAALAAVPADGLAALHGSHTGDGYLTTASERLADQLTYLQAANAHIDGLHPNQPLAAMAIPV
ncbi:hypothetical protein [Virgisporangium aurantiacum]|uniref:Uncharacterized protein n=1 Tax=Virgisporangium aurantiacum TaxID=175570 RepID=A0A8J3ZD54_9ACTN|nr:hypothetical protein [Virgisporangium aurantiacum]GIJ62029.1 hypothetical protein Vau01_095450 [Virgisporangium aurantiacum]